MGDLTGELLGSREAEKTQGLNIEYFQKMGVYEKVPIEQAQHGGHHVRGVGLVGRMEGRSQRSRLVAKEIKTYQAPELVAATPPIESLNTS